MLNRCWLVGGIWLWSFLGPFIVLISVKYTFSYLTLDRKISNLSILLFFTFINRAVQSSSLLSCFPLVTFNNILPEKIGNHYTI